MRGTVLNPEDSVNSVHHPIQTTSIKVCSSENGGSGGELNGVRESDSVPFSKASSNPGNEGDWKRFLGLLLSVAVSLQFSLGGLIYKIVALRPLNFVFWRWTGMNAILATYVIYVTAFKKQNILKGIITPFGRTSCFVMLQAVLRANSGILIFYGFQYIQFGDATVIYSSTPVFVALLAFLFLREPCGLVPIATIVLVLVGVGIISRPPLLTGQEGLTPDRIFGVGTSFCSMLLMASSLVLLRYLREVNHVALNMVFMSWGWLESGLVSYFISGDFQLPADLGEVGLVALSSVLVLSGQTCLVLALKYEQAGPVALLRTTEVIFAFVLQVLFLGTIPDGWSVLGASLTLTGIVLVTLRTMTNSFP